MSTYPEIELVGNLYQHAELLYPGFTTNGNHVTNSWHYRNGGDAVDWDSKGRHYDALAGMAAYFYQWSSLIVELFSTTTVKNAEQKSGHYVKNGQRKSFAWAKAAGLTTMSESGDHIHIAVATEAAAQELLTKATQHALGLTVDGVRGPLTVAAVKAIQHAAGLTQDGVVGPKTVAAIRKHNGWAPTS